jgi:hypothetical protein
MKLKRRSDLIKHLSRRALQLLRADLSHDSIRVTSNGNLLCRIRVDLVGPPIRLSIRRLPGSSLRLAPQQDAVSERNLLMGVAPMTKKDLEDLEEFSRWRRGTIRTLETITGDAAKTCGQLVQIQRGELLAPRGRLRRVLGSPRWNAVALLEKESLDDRTSKGAGENPKWVSRIEPIEAPIDVEPGFLEGVVGGCVGARSELPLDESPKGWLMLSEQRIECFVAPVEGLTNQIVFVAGLLHPVNLGENDRRTELRMVSVHEVA